MKLPSAVTQVINLLEAAGFEAVVVGGAVRDYLLGMTPHDYDISTNALPEQIKAVFQNYHTLDIGIKHGTVTVFINRRQIEITTYRSEEDYEDFRHPKKIIFEKVLAEDIKRRDFTINAICYNKDIIDMVGGLDDLKQKLIRAIGNPQDRFTEDPLRILRALRFASGLDFEIESATQKALFEHAVLLKRVSAERINLEFSKLLMGFKAARIINDYQEIIRIFLPELPRNLRKALDMLPKLPSLELRLAALLMETDYLTVLKRLKYSNLQIKKITFCIDNINIDFLPDKIFLLRLLKTNQLSDLVNLVLFQMAMFAVEGSEISELTTVLEILNKIEEDKLTLRLRDLAVSGRDLLDLGFKQGIGIRLLLEKILDQVIEGKLPNDKEEITKYLRAMKKDLKNEVV
ncbi:MAG: CCA tRNA nucleotidyltransferase [Acholeplasmataceae bacterium]|nr:CCA tRNA nucleotidyltransferase [Acholeplasmataceae bacterium]